MTTLENTFLFGRAGATDRQYHMAVIPTQLRPPKHATVVVDDAGVGHGGTIVRVQGAYWLLGGAYYDEEHWFSNLEGESIEPRDGLFLANMGSDLESVLAGSFTRCCHGDGADLAKKILDGHSGNCITGLEWPNGGEGWGCKFDSKL
eukprot:907756-Prymnesium_polylepis.1